MDFFFYSVCCHYNDMHQHGSLACFGKTAVKLIMTHTCGLDEFKCSDNHV